MCDIIQKELLDEELVLKIKDGDNLSLQILIKRYISIITSKAKLYNFSGDAEDLVQEGRIALYSAALSFDPELSRFSTFANVCIERAMASYIRKFYRKKQIPNSAIVSLEASADVSSEQSPESVFIQKEGKELLAEGIKKELSEREYKILMLYLQGSSYEYIADKFGISVKTVNNSMYRARRKIELLK